MSEVVTITLTLDKGNIITRTITLSEVSPKKTITFSVPKVGNYHYAILAATMKRGRGLIIRSGEGTIIVRSGYIYDIIVRSVNSGNDSVSLEIIPPG